MRTRLACAIAIASVTIAAPAQASEKGWGTASDWARNGLVIAAIGTPLFQDDCRIFRSDYDPSKHRCKGVKDATLTLLTTSVVTSGLKETVSEERPDNSDDRSFPSGHTSISFAAAATLHRRNGWEVGLPAHAIAAFVGLARVKAKKHFVHDVIVGAAIGEAAGWIFTRPRDASVQWLPWGDAHGGGVIVAMKF